MTAFTLGKLPDLVDSVRPAVAHVEVRSDEGHGNGSGFAIPRRDDDTGSGGLIVTNYHVVAGASEVTVRLHDDSEHEATLRLLDESTDLALIGIDATPAHELDLRPLNDVRVGEPVVAIGSPYGFEGTVTSGIVSGLDRTMLAPNDVPVDNMIQTDALVNPGNSGGPLIGLDQRVIGVNDQTIRGGPGMSFAIPAETVRLIYDEMCTTGSDRIERSTLAISTSHRSFTPGERSKYGQRAGAVIVREPSDGTPAARAGLGRGDVIVALDGNVVDEPGDLFRLLNRERIGTECQVEYVRNGERQVAVVVPDRRRQKGQA